jgi:hypothetical protein
MERNISLGLCKGRTLKTIGGFQISEQTIFNFKGFGRRKNQVTGDFDVKIHEEIRIIVFGFRGSR